jgi:hypothetical protein
MNPFLVLASETMGLHPVVFWLIVIVLILGAIYLIRRL